MARAIETYAPESFYKDINEFVQPKAGTGVEVVVAWNERVLGTYHFHRQGEVSVGSHPSCDICVPINNIYLKKITLLKINYGVEVLIPGGLKSSLSTMDGVSGGLQVKTINSFDQQKRHLAQEEMLSINLSDSLKLIIRNSEKPIQAKIIPFLDISSDGFLSLALAIVLSAILALFVRLNHLPLDKGVTEKFYPTPLILQNPQRVAKIILPKKKLNMDVTKKKPKKIAKTIRKNKPKASIKSKIIKNDGDKTSEALLRQNKSPVHSKPGSIQTGKSLKVSKNQGSQSNSKNVKNSKLFSVFSNSGQRKQMDQNYAGQGVLAGLANQATNSFAERTNRMGNRFGSRFRETRSRLNGDSNIGVEGLGRGRGMGAVLRQVSLGQKKSIEIIPKVEEAVISGVIDREGIRKVFFDNVNNIRSCYERELNQNTKLGGKIIINFDIGPGGKVVGKPRINHRGSTIINAGMSDCLISRLKGWIFPDPPDGQVVNVLYPLAFSSRP